MVIDFLKEMHGVLSAARDISGIQNEQATLAATTVPPAQTMAATVPPQTMAATDFPQTMAATDSPKKATHEMNVVGEQPASAATVSPQRALNVVNNSERCSSQERGFGKSLLDEQSEEELSQTNNMLTKRKIIELLSEPHISTVGEGVRSLLHDALPLFRSDRVLVLQTLAASADSAEPSMAKL